MTVVFEFLDKILFGLTELFTWLTSDSTHLIEANTIGITPWVVDGVVIDVIAVPGMETAANRALQQILHWQDLGYYYLTSNEFGFLMANPNTSPIMMVSVALILTVVVVKIVMPIFD